MLYTTKLLPIMLCHTMLNVLLYLSKLLSIILYFNDLLPIIEKNAPNYAYFQRLSSEVCQGDA